MSRRCMSRAASNLIIFGRRCFPSEKSSQAALTISSHSFSAFSLMRFIEFLKKKLNENGSFGLSVDRPDKYEFRQLVTSLVVIFRYVRPRGQAPSY